MSNLTSSLVQNNQTQQSSNRKGVASDIKGPSSIHSDYINAKPNDVKQKPSDPSIPTVPNKLGGAFYLPVTVDAEKAWAQIEKAMIALSNADVTIADQKKDKYKSFALKYFRDSFMLAQASLTQVEGEGKNLYVELRKLEGDGFVFADEFKPELTTNLGDVVKDAPLIDEIKPESVKPDEKNAKDKYLELNSELSLPIIENWLTSFRPVGGMKYDQMLISESLTVMGWNCTDADNFKVLSEYTHDIVGPILSILRLPETTYLPSAFYAAKILNEFAKGKAFEDELLNWQTVETIAKTVMKFGQNNLGGEVTSSREAAGLLISTLKHLAPQIPKTETCSKEIVQVLLDLVKSYPDDADLSKALNIEENIQ